jgi:UDP:flavonoid glycosyltransferase YjiC (YdhE family)
MKTIIFAIPGFNLAEVTRMIEIAKACRGTFEALFASYGGRFEYLIREAGFALREMSPRLTEEKIEEWYQVDRGEKLGTYFTPQELHERVANEIAFLQEIKPAAVVTGFCLSVPISTKVAGVPLVWVIGSPWIARFYKENLGTWPDMMDYPLLRWIPDRIMNWLGNRMSPSFYGLFCSQFNGVARQYGLKPFKGTDYFTGDYALLAEPPEFCGLSGLPPNHHYIGPLIARLNVEIPQEVRDIPHDKPIVYFAMGSSGMPEIVAAIIEGFADKPYRVIAPVKSLVRERKVNVPPNVLITDLLPAHKVNPLADISVIHGGIGTVMTACLAGKPVVGVGMQPEQEANLECLVRQGFAIRLRKKRLTAQQVMDAIDRLLHDKEALRKAEAFQKIVASWDGPTNAARFLEEHFS